MSFTQQPIDVLQTPWGDIPSFIKGGEANLDVATVESFGEEWSKFDSFSEKELEVAGSQYFDIVPTEMLNTSHRVLDVGCGTGRWSYYVANRCGTIEAIDPSKAVLAAKKLTANKPNINITQAGVDDIPFEKASFDFVFSLGVLHHVPDTRAAVRKCVEMVKPGGYFMVYLYYSLDNRGALYKLIFNMSIIFRLIISKLPSGLKKFVCDIIAFLVYLPFVGLAGLFKALGASKFYKKIPLSYYLGKSLNIIRNDALDRFGTPLEQRFSKKEITEMMTAAGLGDIVFSDNEPYWHAVGRKPL